MRAPHAVLRVMPIAIALAACGDPAADESFEGEPVDRIELAVSVGSNLVDLQGLRPRAALVWLVDDQGTVVAHPEDDLLVAESLPASMELSLFELPPAEVERAHAGVNGRLALGQVVVYDDTDLDGRWSPKSEATLGVSDDLVIVYTTLGASGDTIGTLAAGFHHLAPATCPTSARFVGPTEAGTVQLTSKPPPLFSLTCPAPEPSFCAPFDITRYTCRWFPDNYICEQCAAAVFPPDASDAACDAWRDTCLTTYPGDAAECTSEHAVCVAGEPPCDESCLCRHMLDYCLEAADADTCAVKYGDCSEP